MTRNEQAKMLREMAAGWLRLAADAERCNLPPQDRDYYLARATLFTSGAEALERLEVVKLKARKEAK